MTEDRVDPTADPEGKSTRGGESGTDAAGDPGPGLGTTTDGRRIGRWQTVDEGTTIRRGIFGFREVVRRSPRTGRDGRYQILHLDSWVNVIALTPDDEVVLIEQYRHGTDHVTLEIPGGLIEPGEDPARAAKRELLEETGFAGDSVELLGVVEPNPAFQDNQCSTYLVRGARRVAEPDLDDGEDIAVVTLPRSRVRELLREGGIRHALVVAAFYWLATKEGGVL